MLNHVENLRIFSVVAQADSFRQAAIKLSISPQKVTRAIQALELQFGEPLFYRNTRSSTITPFGQQLCDKSQVLIQQIEELFAKQPHGSLQEDLAPIKITMPNAFGHRFLLPALTTFFKHNPSIRLDIRLSDVIDNVIVDQMDIGVRIGMFANNRHVARRVGEIKFHFVATPELLAKFPAPQSIEDVYAMPYTGLIDQNTGRMWPWMIQQHSDSAFTHPVFSTDDSEAELSAVLAGIGVSQLPDFFCAPYLKSGQLVSILPHLAPPPWGIYVYRPQRGPVSERVRLVYDYLADTIASLRF